MKVGQRDHIAALRVAASEEAARLVRMSVNPRGMNETVSACIRRAAILLGWSYRRTEDIWRKEARRIESYEMDQLRAVTQRKSMK